MNWEILIVPLIALAVWVLSSIFRTAEERMEKNRAQERPTADRPRPPQRGQSELDRFLEEARRRREQMQRREESVEPPTPVVVAPPPPPPVAPRPRSEEPALPRREDRPKKTLPVVNQTRPTQPAEPLPPQLAKPTFDLPASMIAPEAPALPSPTLSTPATPIGGANRMEPPILTTLRGLLRDRKSLAAAVVLREILDRPLCMRGEGHTSRQG